MVLIFLYEKCVSCRFVEKKHVMIVWRSQMARIFKIFEIVTMTVADACMIEYVDMYLFKKITRPSSLPGPPCSGVCPV
jgi:hypothetical protein